jgi:putative RecB family exonuclease
LIYPATAVNENEVAQMLTGRDYVSWSQLDTMRRCPRLYAYRYIENAEPAFVSSSLVLGSSLHTAIEHHLRALFEGYRAHPADLVEVLRRRFQAGDDRRPDLPVRWNKTETPESALAQAERMLEAFLDNEASTPTGELLAVEEPLRDEVSSEEGVQLPGVVARVDAVWYDEHALHVVDYKTSRSRWDESKAYESAGQLLLYAHLLQPLADTLELPITLEFVVIGKQKTPVIQTLTLPADPARIHHTLDEMARLWQAILAGVDHAIPHPMNCSTCPFKYLCPAHPLWVSVWL